MPTSVWTLLRDLGLLGVVGAASTASILGLVKLFRTWWAARKRRSEQNAAHLEATYALLDASLRVVSGGVLAAASQRAAVQQRLTEARERLSKCSRKSNR